MAIPVNSDFRDLFAAFNEAGARYLVVGGWAFAYHVKPRYTKDLDVWIEATPENAERVYKALEAFRAPLSDLTEKDLATPDLIYQMGSPPNRIDILTSIDGVTFGEAWPNRVSGNYGDQVINLIDRAHLIRNKVAAGRAQDLADVALLGGEPPKKTAKKKRKKK